MAKGNQNKGKNNKNHSAPIKSNKFKPTKNIISKNLKNIEKPFINKQSPKVQKLNKNGKVDNKSIIVKENTKNNVTDKKIIVKGIKNEVKVLKEVKKVEVSEDEEEDSDVDDIDLDDSEDDIDESGDEFNEDGSDMEVMVIDSDDSDIEEVDSDGEIAYNEDSDESDEEESNKNFEPVKVIKKEVKKVEPTKDVKKVEPTKEVKKVEPTKEVKKVEPAKEVKKVEPAKEVKKVEPAKEVKKVEPAKEVKKAEPSKEVKKVEPAKEVKKIEPAKEVKKAEPSKEVKKDEPSKEVKKDEPAKEVKKVEPAKEVKKDEPAKEVNTVDTVKEVKKAEPVKKVKKSKNKVIDNSTETGKILTEMNKRKNSAEISSCTVFVKNISFDFTEQHFSELLKNIVSINLPTKLRSNNKKSRGYGFLRFSNCEDAKDAKAILNSTTLSGKNIEARDFVPKQVMDDISHVDFNKILLTSFKNENITEDLKAKFNMGVSIKLLNNSTYELTFENKSDAMSLFKEDNLNVNGKKLIANYRYTLAETYDNVEVPKPTVPAVSTPLIKAGMKRSKPYSDDVPAVKKVKIVTPEKMKVSNTLNKTPEKKVQIPVKNNSNKKNKNQGNKKH